MASKINVDKIVKTSSGVATRRKLHMERTNTSVGFGWLKIHT